MKEGETALASTVIFAINLDFYGNGCCRIKASFLARLFFFLQCLGFCRCQQDEVYLQQNRKCVKKSRFELLKVLEGQNCGRRKIGCGVILWLFGHSKCCTISST